MTAEQIEKAIEKIRPEKCDIAGWIVVEYKDLETIRNTIGNLVDENKRLKEDIKFCINTMKNEYECTDKRTNRELHTMVEILEKWTEKGDKE